MAKTKRVSLYLGANSIGGVVMDGKKITASAKFDFTAIEEEVKVDGLTEEVKWEALINRVMRELGVSDEKEVFVSLADKDFIFRAFDLPLMSNRSEVESALTFEIEKYIPFKLDEVRWDYEYNTYPKDKKVSVSFTALKNDNYKKVEEMLTCLGVKPIAIEPSSVSLVRCLKMSKKFSNIQNFVILDYNEYEAYLTFFSGGLPIFNRYFVVPYKNGAVDTEKLFEPLQFSFQYFHREFKTGTLEKMIIVSDLAQDELTVKLREELQITVEAVNSVYFVDKTNARIENVKAFGAINRGHSSCRYSPQLLSTLDHSSKKQASSNVLSGFRVGMIIGTAAVCVSAAIGLSMFFQNQLDQKRGQMASRQADFDFPSALRSAGSTDNIEQLIVKEQSKINNLKKLTDTSKKFIPFIEKISGLLPNGLRPKGVWFNSINLTISEKPDTIKGNENKFGGYSMAIDINGQIYLGSAYEERKILDEFVENLKRNNDVKTRFSSVELNDSKRVGVDEYEVTGFSLQLR